MAHDVWYNVIVICIQKVASTNKNCTVSKKERQKQCFCEYSVHYVQLHNNK